jgi:REP element-mobilizing transposase RayT
MSNHFHVLVRVPDGQSVSDSELKRRYKSVLVEGKDNPLQTMAACLSEKSFQ